MYELKRTLTHLWVFFQLPKLYGRFKGIIGGSVSPSLEEVISDFIPTSSSSLPRSRGCPGRCTERRTVFFFYVPTLYSYRGRVHERTEVGFGLLVGGFLTFETCLYVTHGPTLVHNPRFSGDDLVGGFRVPWRNEMRWVCEGHRLQSSTISKSEGGVVVVR